MRTKTEALVVITAFAIWMSFCAWFDGVVNIHRNRMNRVDSPNCFEPRMSDPDRESANKHTFCPDDDSTEI